MVRLPAEARDFSPQYKEWLWVRCSLLSVVDWGLLVAVVNCRGVKFLTKLYYLSAKVKSVCRCVSIPMYFSSREVVSFLRCAVTLQHYVTQRKSWFIML